MSGVLAYAAAWLPQQGCIRLGKTDVLEPPTYDPGGPTELSAVLQVRDCCRQAVMQQNNVLRP